MSKTDELLQQILDLANLEHRLDFGRFLDWAIREGRAYTSQGTYSLTLTAGSSFTVTFTNPSGYMFIPHHEGVDAEVANKIYMTVTRDGVAFLTTAILPEKLVFDWNQSVPWRGIGLIKSQGTVKFINSDTSSRWVLAGYVGTYLLYTEWVAYAKDRLDTYPRYWRRP